MKNKLRRIGLVLALSVAFSSVPLFGAYSNITRAGSTLFSTNSFVVFSNYANLLYTNMGTNNWSALVAAIYGFTNTAGSNYLGSYTNEAFSIFLLK